MPKAELIATFIAGSAFGSAALYLIRIFIENRLAKDLSATDRKFVAAREFRAKVNETITLFQNPTETWRGNNRTANAMRNFVSAIDLAAKDFAEFFTGTEKTRFTNTWNETKEYCSTTLPRSITQGDAGDAQQAKNVFLIHVSELLSYAKTT